MKWRASYRRTLRNLRKAAVVTLLFSFVCSPITAFGQAEGSAVTDIATPQTDSTGSTGQDVSPPSDSGTGDNLPAPASSDSSLNQASADQAGANSEATPDTQTPDSSDTSQTAQAESLATDGGSETEGGRIFINTDTTHSSSPNVDTETGALTYSYPVTLPPGRDGATPQLTLDYSSNTTDNSDEFGYGWKISIPYISRENKTGSNTIFASDNFYSSLDGELVAGTTTGSTTTYVPRTENGDFRQYTFSNNAWTVLEKDGTTLTFGSSTNARRDDPSDSDDIYSWNLEQSTDSNNDSVNYQYFKDAGQIYPQTITYSNHATSTDGIFSVNFSLETRNDNLVSSETGFVSTTTYRVNGITAKINGNTAFSYALAYTTGQNGERSLLSAITESGTDESSNMTTLPSTSFTYQTLTGGDKSWTDDTDWTVPVNIVRAKQGYDDGARFVDINGDGLPDIIQSSGTDLVNNLATPAGQAIYLNTGSGWATTTAWTLPEPLGGFGFTSGSFPTDMGVLSSSDLGARFADVNHDGYTDIIWATHDAYAEAGDYSYDYTVQDVYINNQHGGWATSTEWTLPSDVLFNDNEYDQGARIADVNGDGLPDILVSNATVNKVYLNNGAGWTQASSSWSIPELFADGLVSDQGVRIADVNGDGLPDILRVVGADNGTSYTAVNKIYINTGNGWKLDPSWTAPVAFDYGSSSYGYKEISTRLTDVNNDGLPDLVRSSSATNVGGSSDFGDGNDVYLNTGKGWVLDSGWTLPTAFKFGYAGHSYEMYTDAGVADMDANGDNAIDFVQAGPVDDNDTYPQGYGVYLSNAKPVDLLSAIQYPEGGTISAAYEASAMYADASGNRANNHISSNLNTVNALTFDDQFTTPYTDTYTYGGGEDYYASSTDNEFAGFATTTRTDARGDTTTTYIHQGNGSQASLGEYDDSFAKIGKPYLTELRDSDGNLYQRTIDKWDSEPIASSSAFVFKARETTQQYDGNSDHRDFATEYTYTPTGDIATTTEWGEVTASSTDGSFADIGSDKRITAYTYATSSSPYRAGFPSSMTVTDQSGTKARQSLYYYDGLSQGSVGAGNLTREDDWIASSTYATTERIYGPYGNLLQEIDPRDATTTYAYDSYHLYPTVKADALGHAATSTYDYSSGKVESVVDPNGYATQTTYDGLDRVLTQSGPDPSTGELATLSANTYTDSRSHNRLETETYLDATTSVSSYQYYDGFGREIQQRDSAEAPDTYVVHDWEYGNDGLLDKKSLPYFDAGHDISNATTTDALFESYAYDAQNRQTSAENAVGTTNTAYDQWEQTVTDPLGHVKAYSYDAFDNLVGVDEHNASSTYTTSYAWDPDGNLTGLTDALGNVRAFTYDGLNRRLSAEDLHAPSDATYGTWEYEYDNDGNLTQTTDPKSQVIQDTYDLLNRKLTENYTGISGTEFAYVYDTCTNGVGYLCSVIGTSTATSYSYTPNGLAASETKTIDGNDYLTSYTYDRAGHELTIAYPDNSMVLYTYNAAGFPETVEQKEDSGDYSYIVKNIDYAPTGDIAYQEDGNGTYIQNTYDPNALYRLVHKQAGYIDLQTLGSDEVEEEDSMMAVPKQVLAPQVSGQEVNPEKYFTTNSASKDISSAAASLNAKPATLGTTTSATMDLAVTATSTTPDNSDFADAEYMKSLASTDPQLKLKAPTSQILGMKVVNGIAKYAYKTGITLDSVSAATSTVEAASKEGYALGQEVVAKRTKYARTFATNAKDIYVTEFSSGDPRYYEDPDGKWWLVGYGITTQASYEAQAETEAAAAKASLVDKVESIFTPAVAHASSVDFYPDADPESSTFDGWLYHNGSNNYSTSRNASSADGYDDAGTTITTEDYRDGANHYNIGRAEVLFDTSSIPDDAVVSSATMNLYVVNWYHDCCQTDNKTYYIVSSNPASTTAATASDYSQFGSTSFGQSSDTHPGGYESISLNSSGVSNISLTGVSKFGVRAENDMTNVPPTKNIDELVIGFSSAEESGTSQDPTLTVVYNAGPSAAVNLETEGETNPASIAFNVDQPEFSAVFVDPDTGDTASAYQIQVSTSTRNWDSPVWDSGKQALSPEAANGYRSSDISYAGSELTRQMPYYWRIKFWDSSDAAGSWSTTTASFELAPSPNPLFDYYYTYDADGNIAAIQNLASSTDRTSDSYVYDDLNRLISHATSLLPPDDYPYRIPITIASTSTSTLEDFPLSVDLGSLPSGFWTHLASSSGADIHVLDSSGNMLPIQVESINASAHTGTLFFKTPSSVPDAATTTYYIVYGDSSAESSPPTGQYGSDSVWSDYQAVYHLDEDPAVSTMLDSTLGNQPLGSSGDMTSSSSVSAIIGKGVAFDGINDLLDYNPATDLAGLPALTLSAWVKPSNDSGAGPIISYGRYYDGSGGHGYDWAYVLSTDPAPDFSVYKNTGPGAIDRLVLTGSTTLSTTTWSYVVATWDGNGNAEVYVNGVLDGSTTDPTITSMADPSYNTLFVGSYWDYPYGNGYMKGDVDEVRISATTTTAARVLAEYENAASPSSLYTIGAEITTPPPTVLATTTYAYDAIGNLLSSSDIGAYSYAGSGYSNPDAVTSMVTPTGTSTTLAYDNEGNLTSDANGSYTWNYKNQLVGASFASTTDSYIYDYQGNRVSRTVGTTTTVYPNKLYEQTGSNIAKHIYLGNDLVATIYGSGTSTASTTFVYSDHLGSTKAVADMSGNLIQSLDYSPYGAQIQNEAASPFSEDNRYIGADYDQESSLSYLQNRYLDGSRGQFLSEDPVFLSLGSPAAEKLTGNSLTSILSNPQSLNSYGYAGDNPITRSDPSGLYDVLNGVVQKGDTLSMITQAINGINKTSYTVAQIAKLNGISNPDLIKVGQQIIPNMTWYPDISNSLSATVKTNAADPSINTPFGIRNFYNKVKTGGPEDYKNQPGQFNSQTHTGFVFNGEAERNDFPANFNFGYVGKSTWWGNNQILLSGAGGAQVLDDLTNGSTPAFTPPYFDNPGDSAEIMQGINYYNNGS